VLFMLVHAGKYRPEDKFKTDTLQKLNTTQKEKQCTAQQNKTKQNWFSRLLRQIELCKKTA